MPKLNALLHAAVIEENVKSIKFLLKHGADANSRVQSPKETLQRLGFDSNPEVFYRYRASSFASYTLPCSSTPRSMIHNGNHYHRVRSFSNVSEKIRNPTALHLATSIGNVEIVQLLVGYGADVNAEMDGDYTPLIIAIIQRHHELVELLVNQGANVNASTKNGKTPIHFAVKSKQIDTVEFLVRSGANINARTDHGVTPLHIAVERKLQDIAEFLLERGSDVNAITKTGVTPLHCAAVKGQRQITELILRYGGDVTVIMKKGEIDVTPLLWVTELERKKITDILYKYVDKTTSNSGFYGRFFKKIWKQIAGKI